MREIKKKMKWIKGHILHEAIVAMGVITVGILGIIGFLFQAIGEGRHIADQAMAVNLAGEGIEIARNILDGNAVRDTGNTIAWNYGFNTPGFFEVDYTSTALGHPLASGDRDDLKTLKKSKIGGVEFYGYTGTTETSFRRSVEIICMAGCNTYPYQIRAIARVYWTARGGRLDNISITSDFYNWR